jgi:hypothetical protein
MLSDLHSSQLRIAEAGMKGGAGVDPYVDQKISKGPGSDLCTTVNKIKITITRPNFFKEDHFNAQLK